MYQNESFGDALKQGYFNMPVAIRVLITINVAVFLLQALGGETLNRLLVDVFAFYPEWQTSLLQPWRLVSYMFLHASGFHLLFNMLWLWWMGRAVEETLGPRTFTVLFLGSGIGGALLDVLLAQLFGIAYVIGASGAVFGVMVAFAMLFPTAPIMLILLPPIQARYLVAGMIALNILLLNGDDNVAQAVHLGGAGVGYLLMRWQQQGLRLDAVMAPFERFWHRLKSLYDGRSEGARNSNLYSVSDVEIVEEEEATELDEILEKISREGYDGLTKAEKKKLFELSREE